MAQKMLRQALLRGHPAQPVLRLFCLLEKQVKIPEEFNDVYSRYNEIQKSQGFDLEQYKGQEVTVYTYSITNYQGYENRDCIYANLLVCNNTLIGGDVCSTSASDGFMQSLKKQ